VEDIPVNPDLQSLPALLGTEKEPPITDWDRAQAYLISLFATPISDLEAHLPELTFNPNDRLHYFLLGHQVAFRTQLATPSADKPTTWPATPTPQEIEQLKQLLAKSQTPESLTQSEIDTLSTIIPPQKSLNEPRRSLENHLSIDAVNYNPQLKEAAGKILAELVDLGKRAAIARAKSKAGKVGIAGETIRHFLEQAAPTPQPANLRNLESLLGVQPTPEPQPKGRLAWLRRRKKVETQQQSPQQASHDYMVTLFGSVAALGDKYEELKAMPNPSPSDECLMIILKNQILHRKILADKDLWPSEPNPSQAADLSSSLSGKRTNESVKRWFQKKVLCRKLLVGEGVYHRSPMTTLRKLHREKLLKSDPPLAQAAQQILTHLEDEFEPLQIQREKKLGLAKYKEKRSAKLPSEEGGDEESEPANQPKPFASQT
jgi:hypothetical protein